MRRLLIIAALLALAGCETPPSPGPMATAGATPTA